MVKRFPLQKRVDERGWLIQNDYPELAGQFKHFLLSTTKPGGVRGNHYNKRKVKWFLVFGGEAELQVLNIQTKEMFSTHLSERNPELIQIDPFMTFSLTNVGTTEMLFFEAINEPFNPEDTDTYPYTLA